MYIRTSAKYGSDHRHAVTRLIVLWLVMLWRKNPLRGLPVSVPPATIFPAEVCAPPHAAYGLVATTPSLEIFFDPTAVSADCDSVGCGRRSVQRCISGDCTTSYRL